MSQQSWKLSSSCKTRRIKIFHNPRPTPKDRKNSAVLSFFTLLFTSAIVVIIVYVYGIFPRDTMPFLGHRFFQSELNKRRTVISVGLALALTQS